MGEENNLTCKQRMLMTCVPCSYLNNPDIASSDYCLCCHEKGKVDQLDIPPLIEMSSTWINAKTPIPTWFIVVRLSLTLGMIAIIISNFSLYSSIGNAGYWFIYFTQWNITIATISMCLKCASMFTIYRLLKKDAIANNLAGTDDSQTRLYTAELEPKTKLWNLHIAHDIFLQCSIPAETMVVFNYWAFVYNGNFSGPEWAFTSFTVHGIGCIFIWIDFLLSAERFYYKATFWPVLLGTLFSIWSLIFTFANMTNEHGKPYIYSSYDWSSSAIKPIGFYFASVIILTIISIIAAFVKNLILMKSDIGNTMIRLRNEAKNANNGQSGAQSGDVELEADRTNATEDNTAYPEI